MKMIVFRLEGLFRQRKRYRKTIGDVPVDSRDVRMAVGHRWTIFSGTSVFELDEAPLFSPARGFSNVALASGELASSATPSVDLYSHHAPLATLLRFFEGLTRVPLRFETYSIPTARDAGRG